MKFLLRKSEIKFAVGEILLWDYYNSHNMRQHISYPQDISWRGPFTYTAGINFILTARPSPTSNKSQRVAYTLHLVRRRDEFRGSFRR